MHMIVHGGPPKTGSTALQLALFRNADSLKAAGIRHFVGKKPEEWALALPYLPQGHMPRILKRDFTTLEDAQAWSAQNWDRLEQVARQEQPDTMLISSEHFANLAHPEAFIDRLRGISDRITYVAYARDPVSLYVSELDEFIRGGTTLDKLRLPHRYGYYPVRNLKRIEQILGAENIVIRNFDRANLLGGDIGRDFFDLLEQLTERPCGGDDFPAEVNASICGAGTAWLLMLNEALPVEGGGVAQFRALSARRQALIQAIREDETLSSLPRLKLAGSELEHLVRQFAQPVVEWVNSIYMEGQIPLQTMSDPIEVPGPEQTRALMRDWIMAYLEPEAVQALARVVVKL